MPILISISIIAAAMACVTLPLSPDSRLVCCARCLGLISALLAAAGGLTEPFLEGWLPRVLALLGMCGIWTYNAVLLNTTWFVGDELAAFDLREVRRRRLTSFAKTYMFFDILVSLAIMLPVNALARGLFVFRVYPFLRMQKRLDEQEPDSSTGDIEEARQSAPAAKCATGSPETLGRPADEPTSADSPAVITHQAVIVNCTQAPSAAPEAAPTEVNPQPCSGSGLSAQEKYSPSTAVVARAIPL